MNLLQIGFFLAQPTVKFETVADWPNASVLIAIVLACVFFAVSIILALAWIITTGIKKGS